MASTRERWARLVGLGAAAAILTVGVGAPASALGGSAKFKSHRTDGGPRHWSAKHSRRFSPGPQWRKGHDVRDRDHWGRWGRHGHGHKKHRHWGHRRHRHDHWRHDHWRHDHGRHRHYGWRPGWGPASVWVPGQWAWNGWSWVWISGHWR